MPRTARIIDPTGGTYHVITRGNNRMRVFNCRADFSYYLDLLQETCRDRSISISHFVLMSNHVHLMLRPREGLMLPLAMKWINQEFARYFQKRYLRVGHVWQGRYKSFLVGNDAYALTLGAYIELNPVRAGIVASPEFYEWSSYHEYAKGVFRTVTPNPAYLGLHEISDRRCLEYRKLVERWGTVPKGTVPPGDARK